MSDLATLEALGFTKDEIAKRVIDRIVSAVMQTAHEDEDGDQYIGNSQFKIGLDKAVRERIDAEVTRVADEQITPRIGDMIDAVTLQKTNAWGEPKAEPISFREYLIQCAERYMTEPVDYQGKPKEPGSYSWSQKSTRVVHMIHSHLQYQIDAEMKKAFADLNSNVAKGLHEAVRLSINETLGKLRVETKIA